MSAQIQVYQTESGQWAVKTLADNNVTVEQSEEYSTRLEALRKAERLSIQKQLPFRVVWPAVRNKREKKGALQWPTTD